MGDVLDRLTEKVLTGQRPVKKSGYTVKKTGVRKAKVADLTKKSRDGEVEIIIGGKKKKAVVPPKKKAVTEYDTKDDWVLTMILMAIMHANPDMPMRDVIQKSKDWARTMWRPDSDYLWRKQKVRMEQRGVRAEASRIRRELYKLL